MPCSRGDVVLVRFPNSDLKTYKKRPALVVQGDGLNTRIPQRIIALITSNLSRTGPTRIAVSRSAPGIGHRDGQPGYGSGARDRQGHRTLPCDAAGCGRPEDYVGPGLTGLSPMRMSDEGGGQRRS